MFFTENGEKEKNKGVGYTDCSPQPTERLEVSEFCKIKLTQGKNVQFTSCLMDLLFFIEEHGFVILHLNSNWLEQTRSNLVQNHIRN